MPYQTEKIKGLIGNLELCHHKAQRHVDLILEAIGCGATSKGRGTRHDTPITPAEQMWRNAVAILSAWLVDNPHGAVDLSVGSHTGKELLSHLGGRSPLKEWQVQRVIAKIQQYVGKDAEYYEIEEHPEHYEDHRDFRDTTVATKIHDTRDGEQAEISLGAAIDHLQPCNWNFAENLVIVLDAINGHLTPDSPFAAHGRNAELNPISSRMRIIGSTLRSFCGKPAAGQVDESVRKVLGKATPQKQELAAMLQEKISGVFG